jgi:hypothetical protein
MEYGLDLHAEDKSDFNPGDTFYGTVFLGPWQIVTITFQDDWFIAIRDNTPIGKDYYIYADMYVTNTYEVSYSNESK